MPASPDLGAVLVYLDGLGRNNNKAWFEEHRPAYESARRAFEQFIDGLVDVFRAPDGLGDLAARDCMARIHRDVRFSKDKSPYKTNFGALIAPGGWRTTTHGYYVSIEPRDRSMAAGGLYSPTPAQLEQFRRAIAADAAAFRRVTHAKAFVETFGEVEGERLKTVPRGYDRDHAEIALLRLKQVTVVHRYSDRQVRAGDFFEGVVGACRAMRPFLNYLRDLPE